MHKYTHRTKQLIASAILLSFSFLTCKIVTFPAQPFPMLPPIGAVPVVVKQTISAPNLPLQPYPELVMLCEHAECRAANEAINRKANAIYSLAFNCWHMRADSRNQLYKKGVDRLISGCVPGIVPCGILLLWNTQKAIRRFLQLDSKGLALFAALYNGSLALALPLPLIITGALRMAAAKRAPKARYAFGCHHINDTKMQKYCVAKVATGSKYDKFSLDGARSVTVLDQNTGMYGQLLASGAQPPQPHLLVTYNR